MNADVFTQSYRKNESDWTPIHEPITYFIKRWAEIKPDDVAFVFRSTGEDRVIVTWKELYEKSLQYAYAFLTLGVQKKDVVGISMRSCPMWLYVNFGVILMGAIPAGITITRANGSDVIATLQKIACCTAFVLDPDVEDTNWSVFRNIIDTCNEEGLVTSEAVPSLKYLILSSRPINPAPVLVIEDLLLRPVTAQNLPEIRATDIAGLFQTSGTTHLPKLVAHTHASLVAYVSKDVNLKEKTVPIRCLNDRPFRWLGGYPFGVISGAVRVIPLETSPLPADMVDFAVKAIKQEKCNLLLTLVPFLHQLLERKELYSTADWPLPVIVVTGQPIDKSVSTCIGTLGKVMIQAYGATELVSGMSLVVPSKKHMLPFCIGAPKEGSEMKIVNDNEDIVPVNTTGELWVKSYGCFAGYFNDDERTSKSLTKDGWYKTDDVGYMSDRGLFFVQGRKSDIILSGGLNVVPSVLEDLLRAHPSVLDAATVPISDDIRFQVVCACVIPMKGSDVTEEALRQFCQSALTENQGRFSVLPEYYLFMESFPLTLTGKLAKRQLTDDAILTIQTRKLAM